MPKPQKNIFIDRDKGAILESLIEKNNRNYLNKNGILKYALKIILLKAQVNDYDKSSLIINIPEIRESIFKEKEINFIYSKQELIPSNFVELGYLNHRFTNHLTKLLEQLNRECDENFVSNGIFTISYTLPQNIKKRICYELILNDKVTNYLNIFNFGSETKKFYQEIKDKFATRNLSPKNTSFSKEPPLPLNMPLPIGNSLEKQSKLQLPDIDNINDLTQENLELKDELAQLKKELEQAQQELVTTKNLQIQREEKLKENAVQLQCIPVLNNEILAKDKELAESNQTIATQKGHIAELENTLTTIKKELEQSLNERNASSKLLSPIIATKRALQLEKTTASSQYPAHESFAYMLASLRHSGSPLTQETKTMQVGESGRSRLEQKEKDKKNKFEVSSDSDSEFLPSDQGPSAKKLKSTK